MRNSVAAPPGGRHLVVGRKDKTYEQFMAMEEMLVEQGRPCRQVLLSNDGGCADSGLRTWAHFSVFAVRPGGYGVYWRCQWPNCKVYNTSLNKSVLSLWGVEVCAWLARGCDMRSWCVA